MKKLNDILPHLLPVASDNRKKFAAQLSFYAWSKSVGKAIRQNTEPIRFKEGKLLVEVVDNQWKKQLEAIKLKLKQQLNIILGEEYIKDISFRLKKR